MRLTLSSLQRQFYCCETLVLRVLPSPLGSHFVPWSGHRPGPVAQESSPAQATQRPLEPRLFPQTE